MTTLTEGTHSLEFLVSEASGYQSREQGTLNSGQSCVAGEVLGQLLTPGAAVAVGTPTGNGTITVSAVVGASTQAGIYRIACVAAASNAGTFNFYAPDGTLIREITVGGGATSSPHLTITIADGATDFVVGDTYTITVAAGDYEALDVAEDDGANIAAAILAYDTDATSADQLMMVVKRLAEVNGNLLTWPSGISDANKAIAVSQLARSGIIVRS